MKASHKLLFALLAAATLAGCGGVARHKVDVTVERKWPAAEIERIRVSEANGSVNVEAAEGATEITLVAHVHGRGDKPKAGEENQGLFDARVSGDTLRIGRHNRNKRGIVLLRRNALTVDYVLRVPPAVALDLQTVNGRIITRGVDGETEATTVNGSIDIETPGTSELSASAVNGRVRAKFLHSFQGAHFKTVNGAVDATLPRDASFAVNLSQVNGDFEASFPLNIRSNPGSRRVSGDVNGGRYELRIITVNGHVELSQLNNGHSM